MRTRAGTLLSLGLAACAMLVACGDDDPPPPPTVEAGDLTVETNPLRLVFTAPVGEFAVEHFVEVGVVDTLDSGRYYDPRDLPESPVTWQVATKATSYDEGAGALTLDNGVILTIAENVDAAASTITIDAAAVDNAVLVRLAWPRAPEEPIYGFGENFASAEAGGSVREMQFRLEPTSESALNETHVPVPLSLWPARGVGVFVQDPRPGAFDVGAARDDRVLSTYLIASPGPLSAHIFGASEPLELLRTYAQLTAMPAMPPMWAFAPQQWRNEHDSSQQVRDDADAMRANDIPGSVMWIDNPWQTAYNDFRFDETRFQEPQQLIDDLTAQGYKVVVWSTPYVNRNGATEDDFMEARAAGYLVTDDAGQPFVFPWQNGPGSLVDFTADGATEWYQQRIARVVDMGIRGFKLDFGEDVVPEFGGRLAPLRLAGGDAQVMHDAYAEGYHGAYLGALPTSDGFLISRSGYYGDQAVNTCIWPGDLDSDFSVHGVDNGEGAANVGGLPAAVSAMLSLSVSGYPFFGSDIGGFRDGPTSTETLIRWTEYAALGTIMQLGGGGRSHNPWDTTLFDAPALDVYKVYSRLHMDLVPYIYTLAVIAATDGTPVTRPTRFVYPEGGSDDATFLVGDALFVAPVIEQGATTREVVLPKGRWIDWWTGEVIETDGQTSRTVSAPLETLPLWRRSNVFVPMFAREADTLVPATAPGVRSYADPAYGRELRLLLTPHDEATETILFDQALAAGNGSGSDYQLTATAGALLDIFTFELDAAGATIAAVDDPSTVTLDGSALALAADRLALESCAAPGCWYWDAAASRLLVRVHLEDTLAHKVTISP